MIDLMEEMIPILTFSEHRKLYNRQSNFFATSIHSFDVKNFNNKSINNNSINFIKGEKGEKEDKEEKEEKEEKDEVIIKGGKKIEEKKEEKQQQQKEEEEVDGRETDNGMYLPSSLDIDDLD
jgi:hypothetical protein